MAVDFEEYVRQRNESLSRLTYLIVGDLGEAQDVLQDVLAALARRWETVSQLDHLDAYVRTAVVNGCTSWWRRARRKFETPVATLPDRPMPFPEPSPEAERLERLLRALPVRQRAVVTLRYYDGMSEKEIAETLGCSPGTVKSQAAKALRSLRVKWAAEDAIDAGR
jgi:RNA polymerase sigma-70 factor (sigma-E family)